MSVQTADDNRSPATVDQATPNPALLQELKMILRRDLKLGPDARVPDDMPLIGGEMDLDSLDILLLVSSIEKHFAIKIPNEVVGRWAFQNVSTLAKFVHENREAFATLDLGAKRSPEPIDWLARLPHGPEFRFVSKVFDVLPGKQASGVWIVDGSEAFFNAHFPGRPVVPGVLIIEALAQIAGLASAESGDTNRAGVLAHVDVKFDRAVVPPANIELHAAVSRTIGAVRLCEVTASVAGQPVARGNVAVKLEASAASS